MKRKRYFLFFIALLLFFTLVVFIFSKKYKIGQPVCKDCNVILISLDTLSANHLPCYGYSRNTAPNLCKFGNENILFDNAFSNASWTLPSHVSIFTGLYPSQHKVFGDDNYLSQNVPFLPEILQNNGYKTYFYMPTTIALPIDKVYNRGITEIHESSHPHDWRPALQKLKQNNDQGNKTFLFLHTYWVHDPYIAENEKRTIFTKNINAFSFLKTYKKNTPGPNKCTLGFLNYFKKVLSEDMKGDLKIQKPIYKTIYEQLMKVSDEKSVLQFCNLYENSQYLEDYYWGYGRSLLNTKDPKTMSLLKDLYDSKIVELDEYLKEVFAYVQNSGLKKNTIIIITADHGEEFMEHGEWGHGANLFDTATKVPLMISIPGVTNKKMPQVSQSVDIVPTLLNILKIKNSHMFSGTNLLGSDNKTKYTIAQLNDENATIRDNEWKLFYKIENNKAVGVQLFNYKKDPQEKNDTIFTNTVVVERLLKNIPK